MSKNLFSFQKILGLIILSFGFLSIGNAQVLDEETTSNSSIFNPMPLIDSNPIGINFNPFFYAPDGAQEILYDNGTVFNILEPTPRSVVQDASLGMSSYGSNSSVVSGYSLADDFQLDATSIVESIDFYTYQTGETGVTITGVFVQIYDGKPGSGGSVIWGDLTTNILDHVELTNGYRELESAPGDTSRRIQKVTANTTGLTLEAGTYWVEVSIDGSGSSGPWIPPITITGQAETGDAIQFSPSSGEYSGITDSGTGMPQGLAFQMYGESGDLEACEGTPDAGTVTGPDNICPSIAFIIKAEGATSGVDGLVRQWQSSPAGQNDWTDIADATNINYNVADGITQDTDFRFVITCSNSGESDESEVHTITVNPISECYCDPLIVAAEAISRVVVADIDNPSDPNGTLVYEDFTDIVGHVAPSEFYEVALEGNTSGPFDNYFTIFIDWNQNGILNDPGEVYEIDSIFDSTGTDGQQATGVISVPFDAVMGATRMRVVKNFGSSPLGPCGNYVYGQAEDYTLMVGDIDTCQGTPDAGVVDGPDSICPNVGFILKALDGTDGVTGLVKQWQSSPAGQNDWSDIEGANSSTFNVLDGINTPTDFRFVLTCTTSGESDATDAHTIVLDSATECFCIPEPLFAEPITRVAISDIDNSSDANSNESYEDFTHIEGHMAPGLSYDGEFEGNTDGPYENFFTVFIDWNQNGSFGDPGEMYEIGSIIGSTGTDGQKAIGTVTVPEDALTGTTKMRVIKNYNDSPTDPCGTYTYGQVEDYSILVAPLEDCEGTPDAGAITVNPDQGNPGSSYTVKATGYTIGNGLTYQWQSNTDNAGWENEGDATTVYANHTAIAPAGVGVVVDWRLVVTCTNSGESAESNTASFTTQDPGCGFETLSNGFEDGFGFLDVNEMANDFIVPLGVVFNVNQVKVNIFLLDGPESLDAAQISFYKDSGNGPGEFVAGEVFIEPSSVDLAGTNFDIGIYTLTFDFDPIELEGNNVTETVYWMGILLYTFGTESTYWEINSNMNTSNGFYTFVDGEWLPITSQGDGVMAIDGDCETLSSMPEIEIFDFAYYPNPVKDVLNITSKTGVQSVTAYNMAGQRVLDMNNSKAANGQVDVSALSQGVYIFRAVLENGQVETFKIVKK